uniref:small monomeric GTPase n=1 Tax=Poecilia formosa TaxID=48698 RepID=A0A096LSM7_POEFO
MSRKKAAKGKGTSKSPKASPSSGRTAKGLAAAGAPSSALVYPSRPSISNSGEFYDIAFKVMLVGDSGVGKTCLLVRFKDGAFLAGSFISTVGIDFRAWLTEIHEYAQQDVVVMLLGNKADSTHDRMVKREEGEKLAKEFGVPFMETSAKSGMNVELAFTAAAKELKHRTMKEPDEPKFQLQEYVDKEMRVAGCCRT